MRPRQQTEPLMTSQLLAFREHELQTDTYAKERSAPFYVFVDAIHPSSLSQVVHGIPEGRIAWQDKVRGRGYLSGIVENAGFKSEMLKCLFNAT